ncbi:hypothetical protein GEMRC1_007058 [Eukaryota sp. GEM-RC1]
MSASHVLGFYVGVGGTGLLSGMMIMSGTRPILPLLLLMGGGIVYLTGGIIDTFLERQFCIVYGFFMSHEVFHVFVLLAAFLHYLLIVVGAKRGAIGLSFN